jgi:hypothetical protein
VYTITFKLHFVVWKEYFIVMIFGQDDKILFFIYKPKILFPVYLFFLLIFFVSVVHQVSVFDPKLLVLHPDPT